MQTNNTTTNTTSSAGEVEIYTKDIYGVSKIYPANALAEKFLKLTGRKCFYITDIETIKSLGFTVVQIFINRI